jgi:hypothetical protein
MSTSAYSNRPTEIENFSLWEFIIHSGNAHLDSSIPSQQSLAVSHDIIPRVVGCWSPSSDKDIELYSASLLALFKPWRTLNTLRINGSSFSQSLNGIETAETEKHHLIENMRYTHTLGY